MWIVVQFVQPGRDAQRYAFPFFVSMYLNSFCPFLFLCKGSSAQPPSSTRLRRHRKLLRTLLPPMASNDLDGVYLPNLPVPINSSWTIRIYYILCLSKLSTDRIKTHRSGGDWTLVQKSQVLCRLCHTVRNNKLSQRIHRTGVTRLDTRRNTMILLMEKLRNKIFPRLIPKRSPGTGIDDEYIRTDESLMKTKTINVSCPLWICYLKILLFKIAN